MSKNIFLYTKNVFIEFKNLVRIFLELKKKKSLFFLFFISIIVIFFESYTLAIVYGLSNLLVDSNFESNNYPLPVNEDILESSRSPASIPSSSAGSPGHLGRSRSHFRYSFNRCCQPQSCARSGSNKVIIIIIRPHQRAGLFFHAFAQG